MSINRKQWTASEVETLLSGAANFTDRGIMIRWVDIAPDTGHSAKSCANKYHQIISRTEGLLTRELINAELARSNPVKPPEKVRTRGAYPLWTGEEDARLLAACEGRTILGIEAWERITKDFPGRSFYAVRQRYLVLRDKAAGIVRVRDRKSIPAKSRTRAPVNARSVTPPPAAEHLTITAAFFGDPLPGRSVLDKQRLGVPDEYPPTDYCKAYELRRPRITLATEPMR